MLRLVPQKQRLALVLDTNVVLDLLHFADPGVAPIRRALEAGRAACFSDAACRDELAHVLSYPQFKIPEHEARRIAADYALLAPASPAAERPLPPLPPCRDPDDQKFLALAQAAGADLLVTKDKALLALARKSARLGFRIATPAGAAKLLEEAQADSLPSVSGVSGSQRSPT
ncbi:MAG: putative toxin-antitoxin system toxin component, PIN family [Rhodocyclaceae bacterium]|jgi:putative PIN family toxin of toxin-antitoxin system|nr:putative toxin-antitoxin system toxin component, PIN family [Rhodocyclaceae bacterium]